MQRNIKLLAIFNFFTDLVFYAPVAIIYFSRISGSLALGMSVFSVTMISSALFEIPTGIFSDLIGRKNTVICGALASVVAAVFYALGGNYLNLCIGAVFEGLARSFFSGNNDALLHDTLVETGKEESFHAYLGKLSSVFQIALAIAAVIGAVIANYSFALVMWISVVPRIIMVLVALFLVDPKHHTRASTNIYSHLSAALSLFRQNKRLQLLSISSMIRYAFSESAYLFRSAFVATLWPIWAIGLSNLISNIGAASGFYFSGRIIKKFSAFKVLIGEIIINRLINFTALLFPTIASPALMGTTSIAYGAGTTAMGTLLQKEFSSAQRATMGSLNSLGGSIIFGVCAIIVGALGDAADPRTAMLVIHTLLLLPLLFYWKLFKHDKKAV